jgi:outer membrane lipoprotein SlyB
VAGALLGDAIAPGGSKTVGAIIGGGAGALLGRAIDRDVKCR